jgi:hypothetical protein
MSLVMAQHRTAQMAGNPHQSKRLTRAFLPWAGRRSNRQALTDAGVPTTHGEAWLSDRCILRQAEQERLMGMPEIVKLMERIP